jgi:hypothetical protein
MGAGHGLSLQRTKHSSAGMVLGWCWGDVRGGVEQGSHFQPTVLSRLRGASAIPAAPLQGRQMHALLLTCCRR